MEKNKFKYRRILLAVIFLIAIILLIMVSRNIIIIKNLQSKVSEYINAENYQITIYNYERERLQIFDTYKKEQRKLVTLKVLEREGKKKIANYSDVNQTNTYIEINQEKIAILGNTWGLPSAVEIPTPLYTNNIFELIVISILSDIKTEECNGQECYKIEKTNSIFDKSDNNTFYLDKKTGLLIRAFEGTNEESGDKVNLITDYKYEFNSVTDEQLQEPDITQYEVQKNND